MTKQITQEGYNTLIKTIKASYKADKAGWDICDVATDLALPFTGEDFESTQDWMTDICLNRNSWEEAEEILNNKLGIKPIERFSRELNIVLFQEENKWIAQCLEYDIGTQAATCDDARISLKHTINAEIALSRSKGKEPLEGIGKAPHVFHLLFETYSKQLVGYFGVETYTHNESYTTLEWE